MKKGNQDSPTVNTINASGKSENNGKITNINDKMEYSLDGVNWTKVQPGSTEISGLLPGNYYLRNAETDTLNASESIVVTVGYDNMTQEQPIVNPKTSDNVSYYVILFMISSLGLIILFKYLKKRRCIKND